MPPPLVLEFDSELLDHFEEQFGELCAWKGYPSDVIPCRSVEFCIWKSLRTKVVSDISRRVVSLSSFDAGYSRYFSCTGLFIKWPGSRGTRSVILTSASLVRSRRNVDNIDNDLRIEVLLPPKQRANGRLEFYNLNYNIAIVSVEKSFRCIRP
uniref:Uncharacterized protein n=1 Tax=Triticum urartu TaxID=4572 RepID=A0A8R7R308_TRIUA